MSHSSPALGALLCWGLVEHAFQSHVGGVLVRSRLTWLLLTGCRMSCLSLVRPPAVGPRRGRPGGRSRQFGSR